MKGWLISMPMLAILCTLLYLFFAEGELSHFLLAFGAGFVMGALLIRWLIRKWLKPEYFEPTKGGTK